MTNEDFYLPEDAVCEHCQIALNKANAIRRLEDISMEEISRSVYLTHICVSSEK